MFRALTQILIGLALLALGADAYWCWKAGSWTFAPISYYVARFDAGALDALRLHALGVSPKLLGALDRFIAWPVWAPASVIGMICAYLAAPPAPPGPRAGRAPDRREAWPGARWRR